MARQVSIKFLGDEKDLARASKAATGDIDRVAKRAGIAGGAVAAGTTAAINGIVSVAHSGVQFLKGAIGEAEEAAKLARVTKAIIKSTGGAAKVSAKHIAEYSQELSNTIGVDDELIQQGQNVLLTFKQIRNETGKGNQVFDRATAAAADLAAVLGGDVKSQSLLLGKALNDPIKGMGKLAKAGVTFTDAQKDQVTAMVEANDILGAQKIILGEVESQVGGAAEANATASEKMTVAWDNFKENIGTAILPAFTALTDFLIDTVLPAIVEFGDKAGDVIRDIHEAVAPVAGVVLDVLVAGLTELTDWAKANADALVVAASALGAFVTSVVALSAAHTGATAVNNLVSSLAALGPLLAAHPVIAITAAIIAVGVAVFAAYKRFEGFRKVVDTLGRALRDIGKAIAAFTLDAINKAIEIGRELWAEYGDDVIGMLRAVQSAMSAVVSFLVNLWEQFGDELTGIVVALADLFDAIFDRIVTVVTFAWEVISAATRAAWATIQPLINAALTIIKTYITVWITGIQVAWRLFGDNILAVIRIVFDQVRNFIETVLGIIQGIIQVVTAVIRGDWSAAWEGIKQIVTSAWEGIKSLFNSALDYVRTVWEGLGDLIVAPFAFAAEAIPKLLTGVGELLSGLFEDGLEAIKNGAQALIDILNAAIRAYNSIPLAPNLPTIPDIAVSVSGARAAVAGVGVSAASAPTVTPTLAPTPTSAARMRAFGSTQPQRTLGNRLTIINLPAGVNGSAVVNAVRRNEQRNSTSGWER